MENELLISATGITKKFGNVTAVDGISLDVRSGGIYGVAGLNGAGKSTLLAILAGVMRPDGGAVMYRGASIYQKKVENGVRLSPAKAARRLRVGYVPQEIALFPDLSVYDNLKFWALASGGAHAGHGRAKPLKERITASAGVAGLSEKLRSQVRSLSGGYKRRVNIAAALVSDPEVLIMDEPTAGLDVKNRRDILNFIAALTKTQGDANTVGCDANTVAHDANTVARDVKSGAGGGLAVVCTSHQSGELEMISDKLLLLDRGRTVYDGPPADVFSGKFITYENIDDILYSMGGGM